MITVRDANIISKTNLAEHFLEPSFQMHDLFNSKAIIGEHTIIVPILQMIKPRF